MNVSDGTSTSSPGCRCRASRNATCSAAVPLAQATAYFAPTKAANSRSNRSTNGPTDDTKFVVDALVEVPAGRCRPDSGSLSAIRQTWKRSCPNRARFSRSHSARAPQPVLERDGRSPAEQLARARRIRLRAPGPRSRRGAAAAALEHRGRLNAERPTGGLEQLADRRRLRRCRAGSSRPRSPVAVAARTKPSTVSATNVRSRRVSSRPSWISRHAARAAARGSSAAPRASTAAARTC